MVAQIVNWIKMTNIVAKWMEDFLNGWKLTQLKQIFFKNFRPMEGSIQAQVN